MNTTTDNPDYENLEEILGEEEEVEEVETETGKEEEEEEAGEEGKEGAEEEEEKEEAPEFKFADDDERVPEKFRGKTPFEVLESYSNLEGMVNTKALDIAKQMLGGKKPDEEAAKDGEVEDDFGLTEDQMKAMTPKAFLAHINKTITERAQKIVTDTLSRTNEVRNTVKTEIRTVTKAHPHLKTNPDYRKIVLDTIEAAQNRGEKLTLTDACKQVDKAMGIKPGAPAKDPAKPKKKPRTAVETTDGPGGGEDDSEEKKVQDGILGAQSTNGGPSFGV